MGRYFDEMRAAVEGHGGRVDKFIGDAVVAVFGVPQLHEDDALRALRAASEMHARLGELNGSLLAQWGVELEARTGVSTGEVVVGEDDAVLLGDVMNTAARLEQAARPGEVLIGAPTLALVEDAVDVEPVAPFELKGKADPVAAYRPVAVRSAPERRYDERLEEADAWVNRAVEIGATEDAFTQIFWRQVKAKLLARAGDHDEAERLAAEAVAISRETDFLNGQGDATADLAEVLLLGGRADDAAAALEQALRLYEQKGNLVSARRVRARLVALGAATDAPVGPG